VFQLNLLDFCDSRQEVMVPFAEIQEIQLKHKKA